MCVIQKCAVPVPGYSGVFHNLTVTVYKFFCKAKKLKTLLTFLCSFNILIKADATLAQLARARDL